MPDSTTTPIESSTRTRRWHLPLLLLSLAIAALDRYTKILVLRHIGLGDTIPVIPRYFRISHVLNTGAAFSLFSDGNPQRVRYLLIAFNVFAILAVLAAFWRAGRTLSLTSVALALILGGAIGNLYDRLTYGWVVDFLEVTLRLGSWSYHWPDFNFADSAIVTGACLLLLEIFIGSRSST